MNSCNSHGKVCARMMLFTTKNSNKKIPNFDPNFIARIIFLFLTVYTINGDSCQRGPNSNIENNTKTVIIFGFVAIIIAIISSTTDSRDVNDEIIQIKCDLHSGSFVTGGYEYENKINDEKHVDNVIMEKVLQVRQWNILLLLFLLLLMMNTIELSCFAFCFLCFFFI